MEKYDKESRVREYAIYNKQKEGQLDWSHIIDGNID
jgi:hypothetical protein